MNKDRPELGAYLAEQALKAKYRDTKKEAAERAELIEFCKQNISTKNAKKFYLRLQKLEINRIIVDTVLKELSPEKKMFVELKYKKNETMVNIAFRLNISVSRLDVWNKNILHEIKNFMFYTLTEKDVFSKTKIINMIHVIDMRVEFFEEHINKNQSAEFVNLRWLESLIILRDKYRQLLMILNDYTAKKNESVENHIIAMKIENPIENTSEIATRCHISIPTASRYLKHFTYSVKNYIG